MTDDDVNSILAQIEYGKSHRNANYFCCGESFLSLFDFRKHLYYSHPKEMSLFLEFALHRELPKPKSKEEIHRLANKGKKKREKAIDRKEKRQARERNRDAYPTPSRGDHFHIILTPMGNKR